MKTEKPPKLPSHFSGYLIAFVFAALAVGAVAELVQLRTRQLGPEQRALESAQLAIARHLLLFENLDALERALVDAKNLPPGGEILTGPTFPGGDAQAEWNHLPESEQRKIQESYRVWQGLAPASQRELLQRFHHFESLPPERQRQLIRGAEALERRTRAS